MTQVEILIIGAGPIGISCGIAAEGAEISYKIIDKGCLVNSIHNFPTNMTFFSSSDKLEIGNVPFTSLAVRPSKQEALEYYRRVADQFELNIGLYETFESMERLTDSDGEAVFHVKTSKGDYSCKNIVNSTGFYDIPILLNIPGEKLKKVRHYFTSAHHLYRQKLAVIGASNSAVDVALEAYRKGADVTLLIRGEAVSKSVKYWVKPDLMARIKEGNIRVFYEVDIQEITEDHVQFEQFGKTHQLANDFVYAMTGYQTNTKLMDVLGIEIDQATGYPKYDSETMQSNVPDIYLAGVVCGGLHTREWFIENSRDHGSKIIKHIQQKNGLKK